MKKNYLLLLTLFTTLTLGFISCSDDDDDDHIYLQLDLDNFDLSDGVETIGGKYWKNTFVNGTNITSKIFKFSHTVDVVNDGYWDGFTVCNSNDNSDLSVTPGWYTNNQFNCMPKGGVNGIGKPYIVAYAPSKTEPLTGKIFSETEFKNWIKIGKETETYKAFYVRITNSPIAYYSIKNGDGFAKKFNNDDEDYFKINIYGVNNEMKISDPVEFFLADYRSKKTDIVSSWEKVDLTPLGEVKYIVFTLESTDNNDYGMLTPAYFCLDKLTVDKIN